MPCDMISIQLNGEVYACEEGLSLAEVLTRLSLKSKHYVVEKNLEIIDPKDYATHVLVENDVIEVIVFMGGGADPISTLSLEERFKNIRLYPVTCEELSCGRSDIQVVEDLLEGGVQVVQYRNKKASRRTIFSVAQTLRSLTRDKGALLIINDYIDVAMAVDADGVHLGQNDIPCREARRLLGPDKIIGISCHSIEDLVQAEQDGTSYANIGPLFVTQTKETSVKPVGLELFLQAQATAKIPLTVMGGIHQEHFETLIVAGVQRIAMISELTQAKNIRGHTRLIINKLGAFLD